MTIDAPSRAAFDPAESDARIDAQARRGRIDSLASIWIVAAAAAALGVATLDRLGAPAALCVALLALGAPLALAGCGVAAASGRASRFHLAGRALTAPYLALALLAPLAAAAGVFLWPGAEGRAPSGAGVLAALVAVVLAPLATALARRADAVSIADLEATRFGANWARRAASVPALAASALLLAAGLTIATDALVDALAPGRGAALAVATAATCLIVVPGGLGGAAFAAAGAGLATLAGLAATTQSARWALAGGDAPVALFAADGLIERGFELVGRALAAGLETGGPTRAAAATAGLALGLALSPLLIGPAAGAPSPREARRGGLGLWALAALLVALGGALAALVALPGPTGWREVAPALAAAFGAPGLDGAPRGFLAVVALAPGLALAGLGAQGLAHASGRDALFAIRDAGALSSRRLAAHRLTALLGVVLVAVALSRAPLDPRLALAAAAGVSAAGLAPAALIALWPRANGRDAAFGALAGLAAFAAAVAAGFSPEAVERIGIAASVGAGVGLAAALAAGLSHPADPMDAARSQALRRADQSDAIASR